jgi:transposase-like protein
MVNESLNIWPVARSGFFQVANATHRAILEAGKKRLAGDTAREATSDEVKELKAEARQLRETLAEVLIENRLLKKRSRGWGGRFMRYSASEKFEIIELVEQSSLSIRCTLAPIGFRATARARCTTRCACKCAITWVTPSPPWGDRVQLNSPINVSGLTGAAPQSSGRPVRHVFEPTAYHSLKR